MKKMIFLMLVFFMGISAGTNAQVNIGSGDGPQPGAVLDLSQGSQKLGLILPNVSLANVGTWQLDAGTGVEGTVVYNTNADLEDAANSKIGKGIFVWVGNGWQAAKSGAGSVDVQPVSLTGFTLSPTSLSLTAGGAPGTVNASAFTFSDGESHPAPAVSWVTTGAVNGSVEDKQDGYYTVNPGNAAASWTVVASAGSYSKPAFNVTVTCPTAGIALSSAPGTNAQSVNSGTAITDIKYNLTNVAATGGATVEWDVNPGLTVGVSGGVLTISGSVPAVASTTTYSYTIKLINVCGSETTPPAGNGSITATAIAWSGATLTGAAKDYNITPTTNNDAGTAGDMAKGWNPIDNSTGMGNYWSTYPATGVTPSSGGTDLMVSNKVYSGDNEASYPNPGGEPNVAAWNSTGMDTHITWSQAVQKCNDLTEGGYTDWYLPNAMELAQLHTAKMLGRPLDWKYNGAPTTYYVSSTEMSNTQINGYQYWSAEMGGYAEGTPSLRKDRQACPACLQVARCVRRTN